MNEIITFGQFRCMELSPHKNRGLEITYIEKGNLDWMVEGTAELVPQGSVFFTLPWQVHGSLHDHEPDNNIYHILFHLNSDYATPRKHFSFAPSFGFTKEETRHISETLCNTDQHCHPATGEMRWLMPRLIRALQGNQPLSRAHALSLLQTVIIELTRIVAGEAVDADTRSPTEKRVEELLEQLPLSCEQSWTLASMARHCGIGRSQLNTIVQRLTGCTPMEYVARLRIEQAKTQLRETDRKVIDIAYECGFSSSQYFANTFKQAVGETPSCYRKHCRRFAPGERGHWKNIDFRSEAEEITRVNKFSSN